MKLKQYCNYYINYLTDNKLIFVDAGEAGGNNVEIGNSV